MTRFQWDVEKGVPSCVTWWTMLSGEHVAVIATKVGQNVAVTATKVGQNVTVIAAKIGQNVTHCCKSR